MKSNNGQDVVVLVRQRESESKKAREAAIAIERLVRVYNQELHLSEKKKSNKAEKNKEQRRRKKEIRANRAQADDIVNSVPRDFTPVPDPPPLVPPLSPPIPPLSPNIKEVVTDSPKVILPDLPLKKRFESQKATLTSVDWDAVREIPEYVKLLGHKFPPSVPLDRSIKEFLLSKAPKPSKAKSIVPTKLEQKEKSLKELEDEEKAEEMAKFHAENSSKPTSNFAKVPDTKTPSNYARKGKADKEGKPDRGKQLNAIHVSAQSSSSSNPGTGSSKKEGKANAAPTKL